MDRIEEIKAKFKCPSDTLIIHELIAALEKEMEQNRWIPVTPETMPDECQHVWVYDTFDKRVKEAYWVSSSYGYWFWSSAQSPSLWRPIPEPLKGE